MSTHLLLIILLAISVCCQSVSLVLERRRLKRERAARDEDVA